MRRRLMLTLAAGIAVLPLCAAPAAAELTIQVNKTAQRMTVSQDGQLLYVWPVSTGRAGMSTPSGTFTPFRMSLNHVSHEYNAAPMPHSIFFTRTGDAIHGTFEEKWIGNAVSHGCVRLSPAHAAILWDLVIQEKMANTKVVLTGRTPRNAPLVAHATQPQAAPPDEDGNEDVTASVAPRYQRRWSNDDAYAQDAGRYYYHDDAPPPPPAFVPERRDRYDHGDDNGPLPFPFVLFGQ